MMYSSYGRVRSIYKTKDKEETRHEGENSIKGIVSARANRRASNEPTPISINGLDHILMRPGTMT